MNNACPHYWVDPCEAKISRARYSPVVGSGHLEMKLGKFYVCEKCGSSVMLCLECRRQSEHGKVCQSCSDSNLRDEEKKASA